MFCKIFGEGDKQLLVRKDFDYDESCENPYQLVFEIFKQVTVTLVLEFEEIGARDAAFNQFDTGEEYLHTYATLVEQSEPFRVPDNFIN